MDTTNEEKKMMCEPMHLLQFWYVYGLMCIYAELVKSGTGHTSWFIMYLMMPPNYKCKNQGRGMALWNQESFSQISQITFVITHLEDVCIESGLKSHLSTNAPHLLPALRQHWECLHM